MGNIIGIHTQTGALTAYTAEPVQAERAGSILLLHDVWGLDDHTKSVADRLARQGYHVIAPNLLAGTIMEKQLRPELREGLFSPSRRQRAEAQTMLQRTLVPLKSPQVASVGIIRGGAAFEYAYNQTASQGRVSIMGFGFGGTLALQLAIRENRLRSVVTYYAEGHYIAFELRHINCPILAFYGQKDQMIFPSFIRLRPQMAAAQVDFTPVVYENAGPFFFDESMTGAYDSYAAADSWSRAMSFYQKSMR